LVLDENARPDSYIRHVGVARGGKGAMPPKFVENIVILCFERVFLSKIVLFARNQTFWPPQNFLGWLRHW